MALFGVSHFPILCQLFLQLATMVLPSYARLPYAGNDIKQGRRK